MNPKLQQAIAAVRSGQKKEAQFLLTQVLKEDPDESQAWFLLSQIVDSEQKRLVYLRKTVDLNPDHELAAQRLAQLEGVEPVAEVSLPEEAVEADPELAMETYPEAEEEVEPEGNEPEWGEPMAASDIAVPEVSEPFDTLTEMLAPVTEEPVVQMPSRQLAEEPSVTKLAPVSEPFTAAVANRRDQQAVLTRMLYVLSAAALIVLIALIYVIITSF